MGVSELCAEDFDVCAARMSPLRAPLLAHSANSVDAYGATARGSQCGGARLEAGFGDDLVMA